jgi:phosphoglycolate phosphatase
VAIPDRDARAADGRGETLDDAGHRDPEIGVGVRVPGAPPRLRGGGGRASRRGALGHGLVATVFPRSLSIPVEEPACLLFDLDGVIADSRVAITRCMNHALAGHGLETRPEAELARHIGPPLVVAFRELLAAQEADPALAEACVALYRERYETACVVETMLYAGVDRAVERLAARRPLAVATSKPTHYAEPILRELGLREAFRAVVGPSLDPAGEPKSATVGRALAALDVPGPGVMVGDRRHDVEAARAHGLAAVGVTWGFGTREELETAGADRILDVPHDLTTLL